MDPRFGEPSFPAPAGFLRTYRRECYIRRKKAFPPLAQLFGTRSILECLRVPPVELTDSCGNVSAIVYSLLSALDYIADGVPLT